MNCRRLLLVLTVTLGAICAAPASLHALGSGPSNPGEAAWALHYDPKTLDPAKVDDDASELVRFLTAGVLIRLNRVTMQAEPELADRWALTPDGKTLTFHLRAGLHFSDGSPLNSADVVATLRRVLSPTTAAPVADEFIEPAKVRVEALDDATVIFHLPIRIVNLAALFDEIAVEPGKGPTNSAVTAGPYVAAEYRRGESLALHRNPFYWRHDDRGAQLPYLASLRLDILANRETEELRFLRGQYVLLNTVTPDSFDLLSRRVPSGVRDLGPSLNTEQLWFNQAEHSPLPAYENAWFTSKAFRTAISQALHRNDMVRIAFNGHATPANGFISPRNATWYNRSLPSVQENVREAQRQLASAGFQKRGNQLFDRDGHPVGFSLLTNAGNHARERIAALIQQDLAVLGIQVTVVTLDFPALVERLMHTSNYEAALLGLSDVQPDPSSQMNIWLSSSPMHQWNPSQKVPSTSWEAEIDKEMRLQAATSDQTARKLAMDRVQAIVAEEHPFIYLVYPNTLCAVSPRLEGEQLTVLQPAVVASIPHMRWKGNGH